MSNPTELPDLDKLSAEALECLHTLQYLLSEPEKQLVLAELARRAQQAESGSIEDYNEFNRLLDELEGAKVDAHACGNDFGTGNKHQAAYENLVAYIDKWADRRAAQQAAAPD